MKRKILESSWSQLGKVWTISGPAKLAFWPRGAECLSAECLSNAVAQFCPVLHSCPGYALKPKYLISMLEKPLHNDELTFLGSICYSLTCGILSGVCIIATVLSLIVVCQTRRIYSQLYGKSLSWVSKASIIFDNLLYQQMHLGGPNILSIT